MAAFRGYDVKRKYCEDAEEQATNDIDGVMEHAIDGGNREEQACQPVNNSEPFKIAAPPPRDKKRYRNMRTWKS